jgi:hypothetical protein
LKVPIETTQSSLRPIRIRLVGEFLKEAELRPEIERDRITRLHCSLVYEDQRLTHMCWAGKAEEDGVDVHPEGEGRLMSPEWDASKIVDSILYSISGMTLQAHIHWRVEHTMREHIESVRWILPDGRSVPRIEQEGPWFVSPEIRGAGKRPLSDTDWSRLQDLVDGVGQRIPLWSLILAEAHRARETDMRSVVVYCATALDVGVQPLLPPGDKVDMRVFRGESPANSRTPDLRQHDGTLYDTVSRLWYTRHGIVHRGETQLYDRNPARGAPPLRPLRADDVFDFLRAVPRAMCFLEANPP